MDFARPAFVRSEADERRWERALEAALVVFDPLDDPSATVALLHPPERL